MDSEPNLPIAISYIGSKYLIFDVAAVTWLRRTHHICGVMTGTLPQAPSQNVFLGLPVHIMPEEAQLLIDKGVAYILNDAQAHERVLRDDGASRHEAYISSIRSKGQRVSIARHEEKEEMKRQSLKQAKTNPKPKSKSKSKPQPTPPSAAQTEGRTESNEPSPSPHAEENSSETSLFDDSPTPTNSDQSKSRTTPATRELPPHNIVPTTSDLWLPNHSPSPSSSSISSASTINTNDHSHNHNHSLPPPSLLPHVPPTNYALYAHLHAKSYFMTPGLRFGCQYCVYPGDPLRFHSHFLATAVAWDEPIDLMRLVAGGRLGTGVKKGFLIGGEQEQEQQEEEGGGVGNGDEEKKKKKQRVVRTLSIEWAAM